MSSIDVTDPVEEMLKKTGCISLHIKVQECIAETQDWRETFKKPMKMMKLLQYTRSIVSGEYPLKMVLVVRTDLKLGKGKIASQCSHAAILCYQESLKRKPDLLKTWSQFGQPKIVLKVENLSELEELHAQALGLGIVAVLVRDAGKTQVAASTITTLGLGPHSEALDTLVKPLKLL